MNRASFWEIVKFVVITALIVVPFRMWVAQPFIVSGASMEQTYHNGDYLIVDELTYDFRKPKKDEVIIFKYPKDTTKYFIKRIINLPGETVEYGGKQITLGEDEYFVMGDNRPYSSDSRVWGPVKEDLVVGKVFLQLWSGKVASSAMSSVESFIKNAFVK